MVEDLVQLCGSYEFGAKNGAALFPPENLESIWLESYRIQGKMVAFRIRKLCCRWVKGVERRYIIKEWWVETNGNPDARKMRDIYINAEESGQCIPAV